MENYLYQATRLESGEDEHEAETEQNHVEHFDVHGGGSVDDDRTTKFLTR